MASSERKRLRELGVTIGRLPTGPLNAITDVSGVWVGQTTVIRDQLHVARTGVTVILPRAGRIHENACFAGFHCFNGIGEMTGLPFLEETGLLTSPVVLTSTNQVGTAYSALVRFGAKHYGGWAYKLPVVAETWDGWLNDMDAFPLTEDDVIAALEAAGPGPVAEGNTGGGTGMICHDFKGGTGTSSRRVSIAGQTYTVGALVQANYGDRHLLRVDGVPVGRILDADRVPLPWQTPPESSSIVAILATDAPLSPLQCRKLAQRAIVGLARVGGIGDDGSGDLFLAFSTGNDYMPGAEGLRTFQFLAHNQTGLLVEAAAEAVEEAILNALCMAETMTGYKGRSAHALPLDELGKILREWRALSD
jgi:D-aminopeptidase